MRRATKSSSQAAQSHRVIEMGLAATVLSNSVERQHAMHWTDVEAGDGPCCAEELVVLFTAAGRVCAYVDGI